MSCIELLKRTGDAGFAPEMTVREAQMLYPQAQQIQATTWAAVAVAPSTVTTCWYLSAGQWPSRWQPVDGPETGCWKARVPATAEHQNGLHLQPVKIPNVPPGRGSVRSLKCPTTKHKRAQRGTKVSLEDTMARLCFVPLCVLRVFVVLF